jgi:hypothetical protein
MQQQVLELVEYKKYLKLVSKGKHATGMFNLALNHVAEVETIEIY